MWRDFVRPHFGTVTGTMTGAPGCIGDAGRLKDLRSKARCDMRAVIRRLRVGLVVMCGMGIVGLTSAHCSAAEGSKANIQKAREKALNYLRTSQPDGGSYSPKTNFRNYETCIVLLALKEANSDGKFTKTIANADKFLRKEQIDEDDDTKKSDAAYGGAGYGPKSRPDLSNTQFLLDALQAAGAKPEAPAVQKALIVVSRSQSL